MALVSQRLLVGRFTGKRARNLLAVSATATIKAMSAHSSFFRSPQVADAYSKFRPGFGPELLDTIVRFCEESPPADTPFSLAIDVGCGPGQSTVPLAQRFQRVIGVDTSEAQISRAPTHLPNVSFRVGSAEDLSFAGSGSVDLVVAGNALHWFDLERFYAEMERVLKPGGAVVAYCHQKPVVDEPEAQDAIYQMYYVDLREYWPQPAASIWMARYHTLPRPFPGSQIKEDVKIEMTCTVDELVGYYWSLTAYQTYLKNNPTGTLLSDVEQRLKAVYQDGRGGERPVQVTWPIFMLMGHKPRTPGQPRPRQQ